LTISKPGLPLRHQGGISIGIDDLVTPESKKTLVAKAEQDVIAVGKIPRRVITNGERYNKVIAIWSEVTDKVAKENVQGDDEREKSAAN